MISFCFSFALIDRAYCLFAQNELALFAFVLIPL